MIIGIGTDLVDVRRIETLLDEKSEAFLEKIFSQSERAQGDARKGQRRFLFFATRFAAKEACAKALGTGIAEGVTFRDIVIQNDSKGRPFITLEGEARALLDQKSGARTPRIDLSLSDEYPMGTAFVVISAE